MPAIAELTVCPTTVIKIDVRHPVNGGHAEHDTKLRKLNAYDYA
jgi:hypothetical protein